MPGSLKSRSANPKDPGGVQPACGDDRDGEGGSGMSPVESTAEEAGALQRSVTVTYES